MDAEITKIYGKRVRIRVCGLYWSHEDILLVEHQHLHEDSFWSPPGGGIEYGETAHAALTREWMEETGLQAGSIEFAFTCQFIKDPLHSIELFFMVKEVEGNVVTGFDPELPIIRQVKFIGPDELASMSPASLHGIFRLARTKDEFRQLSGFYSI